MYVYISRDVSTECRFLKCHAKCVDMSYLSDHNYAITQMSI